MTPRKHRVRWLLTALLCVAPVAVQASPDADDPSVVRVRTIKAARDSVSAEVVITGDVQAQAQTNVSFRTNGKVARRLVEVGEHVTRDRVLALLEPQEQKANLDNARAALASAEALLTQAKVQFQRQAQLLAGGYTTRPAYDNAEQQWRTTEASVEAARATLGTAQEQLSYTELRAGVDGIVLSRSFEVGQVVQAGQTVLVLAQDGPRDAVFNVYEALLTSPPAGGVIEVALQARPEVRLLGRVREIAPSVDPASGTVRVKVGLDAATPMALGAVVTGRGQFVAREAIVLPWSALYRWDGRPAVWIHDRARNTVAPRIVRIERFGTDTIALAGGVEPGEAVVVAGIQFLRPGQTVDAEEAPSVPLGAAR